MTTVSVVIPAYNHAAFLRSAIKSVLSQTWQEYEIIVVDDGSRDETPAVAAEFGSTIRYIRQQNQGMAATRNHGIRRASGDVISFLDDDDLWLPDYLTTVVSHFGEDPDLAAIHTGYQLTSDQDGQDYPRMSTRTVPSQQLCHALLEAGFFPPSTISVRRSCLESVGLFDEALQGCADWDLCLRICREHKFIGIPDVLVKYRLHSGGLSSNVQHMTEDRLKTIYKHFGPPEGLIDGWSSDKRRAYAFAYRSAAIEYNMQGETDQAWYYMEQAVRTCTEVLTRLDTFYELACGDQPRGYRGEAELLDIDRNATEVINGLNALFTKLGPPFQAIRREAYGYAYLAFGLLGLLAGRFEAARYYFVHAASAYPPLLVKSNLPRNLLKAYAGSRAIEVARWLRA